MVTLEQLKEIMPRLVKNPKTAASYFPHLIKAMEEFQINTELRMAAFLAQLAHESYELKYLYEIWGPTVQQLRYEPPNSLATKLGNLYPGDGFKFRGRGPIQLTGRTNYQMCGKALGVDLGNNPDLAVDLNVAFRIAGWFWDSRHINILCDLGDFEAITKKINGGLTGYDQRLKYYVKAKEVFKIS